MTTRSGNWWPVLVALGVGFLVLNVVELVFLDGGAPQIVGAVLGFGLIGLGIARRRGWAGVRR
jgi:hypothetical protein